MNTNFIGKAFNFFKDTMWAAVHKDAAKMLIGMGALGFALSSMAQCYAIKTNDKIDNKKKGFLLRQEAADGAVNIGLFLAVTSSIWKLSDKILKSAGLLGNKTITEALANPDLKQVISGGRIATTMIASVLACNVITPLIRNLIAGKITACKDKQELDSKLVLLNADKNMVMSPFKDFDRWAVLKVDNYHKNLRKSYPSYSCLRNSGSMKV